MQKCDGILNNSNKYVYTFNKTMWFMLTERRKLMAKEKTMYVDADEVARDWGVSKPTAYRLIRELNSKIKI